MKENGPLLSILLIYKNQVLWNMNKAKMKKLFLEPYPILIVFETLKEKYGISFICSKKNTKMIVKNSEH